MSKKILITDDEKEIRELISIYLLNEGYEVIKASNGEEALNIIDKESIDLIILDIMMPGIDGIEVCKRVRERLEIPILMLSAKSEDMDKIQGLITGADDYMTKPFNPLELAVRVKALLRRAYYFNEKLNSNSSTSSNKDIIQILDMTIYKNKYKVLINEEDINLTSREFEILLLLAENKGQVFSTEDIFKKVWKEKYYQSNNTVMVHMSRIREKINSYMNENIIHTVWGVGYKIEE